MNDADALIRLIETVGEKGAHSFECESLRQAHRIKYRFYDFRELLEAKLAHDRPRTFDQREWEKAAEVSRIAQRIMVSINQELYPPVLEFSLRDKDDDLIMKSIERGSSPPVDQEGALNKLLKKVKEDE